MRLSRAKKHSAFAICSFAGACQLKMPAAMFDKISPTITSYSINGVAGTISSNSIAVTVGKWTGLKGLTAKFTHNGIAVYVKGVKQDSDLTANDFSNPLEYIVETVDGSQTTYTVTAISLFPFADTGQTDCASGVSANSFMAACPNANVGAVQDGDHVNKPAARSFTGPTQHTIYTSDYITRDNVTGLIWKSCTEGLTGAACASGTAATYARNAAGVDAAANACLALNAGNGYAGLKTWRLPAHEELWTLPNFAGGAIGIDAANFPATVNNNYWSSTSSASLSSEGWVVGFFVGQSITTANTTAAHVRCVANNPIEYRPPFTDNGDGSVTSLSTGLIWQKCSMGLGNNATCTGTATTGNWLAALTYCQGLSLAGRSWRVPNVTELRSLVDYAKSNPAINGTIFPNTLNDEYWSSSTYASTPANAWSIDFAQGIVQVPNLKTAPRRVRCVSGP